MAMVGRFAEDPTDVYADYTAARAMLQKPSPDWAANANQELVDLRLTLIQDARANPGAIPGSRPQWGLTNLFGRVPKALYKLGGNPPHKPGYVIFAVFDNPTLPDARGVDRLVIPCAWGVETGRSPIDFRALEPKIRARLESASLNFFDINTIKSW